MRNHAIPRPAALGLILLLCGCAVDKGGPDEADGDGGLPQGHYLLTEEKDGLLGTEEYFVVLPDSAWELVTYWFSNVGVVCGVSRTRGTYTMDDSSIALIEVESGQGPDKCPITQSDFDGISWEAAPTGSSTVMDIRNVTADSFEASGAIAGGGWMKLYRQADPHGFYD